MLKIRPVVNGMESCLYRRCCMHLVLAFVVVSGILIATGTECAAEVADARVPLRQFPAAQVFTFLFLMLGPFKIIGPFAKVTKGADARLTRQIAVRATIFAALALLIAGLLGESFLSKYGIPLPLLALSAGIILFLVALKNILEQFVPPEPHPTSGHQRFLL